MIIALRILSHQINKINKVDLFDVTTTSWLIKLNTTETDLKLMNGVICGNSYK